MAMCVSADSEDAHVLQHMYLSERSSVTRVHDVMGDLMSDLMSDVMSRTANPWD